MLMELLIEWNYSMVDCFWVFVLRNHAAYSTGQSRAVSKPLGWVLASEWPALVAEPSPFGLNFDPISIVYQSSSQCASVGIFHWWLASNFRAVDEETKAINKELKHFSCSAFSAFSSFIESLFLFMFRFDFRNDLFSFSFLLVPTVSARLTDAA